MSKIKKFIAIAAIPLTAYFGYQTVEAYRYSSAPSEFEVAAHKLGFNSSAQQEALLKTFYLAGYFKSEKLWKDLNRMGGVKDPGGVFNTMYVALVKAGANQDEVAKFNPKILRKNFLKSDLVDAQDAADLLLYIGQHAFNRKAGQERNELTSQDWMVKHKDIYWQAAKELGLIDSIEPQLKEYQAQWIAGASRVGVLTRLIWDEYICSTKGVKVTGPTSILAGNRELWANIDGISPGVYKVLLKAKQDRINIDDISVPVGEEAARTAEGREYMSQLAKKNNIQLDPSSPFVSCKAGECPPGRFPGRDYANYVTDGAKLTESLMARDLLSSFFPGYNQVIIDTQGEGSRPNTSTTARDAAGVLVKEIQAGKYSDTKDINILFVSNNPYIERQTMATRYELDKAVRASGLDKQGYKVKVEGIGFACKQDVATIHSELGALMGEKWKMAVWEEEQRGIAPKRDPKALHFQTRDNDSEVPPMPAPEIEVAGGNSVYDYLVGVFDEY